MGHDHTPLPLLWLLSDARNDTQLERALAALPPGSGFVYRHYHLPPSQREARFAHLAKLARSNNHCVILSDDAERAAAWGAAGVYGPVGRMPCDGALLKLVTAHDRHEIAAADRAGAHGIFVSPVFRTRSHRGGTVLGAARFHRLAAGATAPIIALGGMNPKRAADLQWPRWGAIDGLS